jgi:hypothetical protein
MKKKLWPQLRHFVYVVIAFSIVGYFRGSSRSISILVEDISMCINYNIKMFAYRQRLKLRKTGSVLKRHS